MGEKCDCGVSLLKAVKERDYKAVRLGGIYYGAFFDDNQSLIDYVNTQKMLNPLVCLGDGFMRSMEVIPRVWH